MLFISFSTFAQLKHLTKLNHGYSFNINSSWAEADRSTLQKKIAEDKIATGKDLNYDYVFSESSSNITYPFIVVSPLYAGTNLFEDFKKSYVSKFDPTVIKYADSLSKKLDEINFNENSVIIDATKQSITSTVKLVSNDLQLTSLTYICFNNQYTIQFVFCARTEDFPLLFITYFEEVIKSIKTFKVAKQK